MNRNVWKDNDVQFPRLLAEINAVGLTQKQYLDLGSSMDLAKWEIDELLERAEAVWEKYKLDFFGTPDPLPVTPKRKKHTKKRKA